MATYTELHGFFNDSVLLNRIRAAVIVAAHDIATGPAPTAKDNAWAAAVVSNPTAEARKMLMFVLAANKDATASQINDVTDAVIQSNVDALRGTLIDALAGV